MKGKIFLLAFFCFINISSVTFAQWVQTNGPRGGVVTTLATNGSTIYIGTLGVLQSINNGISWTSINDTATYVASIVVKDTNIILGTGQGVYLSTDGGKSWKNKLRGKIYALTIIGSNLFAGTLSAVYLSTDNGISWNNVSSTSSISNIRTFAVYGTTLFVCTSGRVFHTTDNGQHWILHNSALENIFAISLAVHDTTLYLGTVYNGMFTSTINDTSWKFVDSIFTNKSVNSLTFREGNTFVATSEGVFLSSDKGKTWSSTNIGLTNTNVTSLIVGSDTSNSNYIFAGTEGGGIFLSSDNGASWTPKNTGLPFINATAFAFKGTTLFTGTSGGGVFHSTDNGNNWIPAKSFITNSNIWSLAINGSNLFAGSNGNGVFLSTNDGLYWTPVNSGLTSLNPFSLLFDGSNLFVGAGNIYVSTNNGSNWSMVHPDTTDKRINCMTICQNSSGDKNIFAGGNGILRSTDDGISWAEADSGLPFYAVISLIAIPNGSSGTDIFVGTGGGGVFRSTNYGRSWNNVDTGLTHLAVQALAVSGRNIFAGCISGGIFMSTNNGTNWIDCSAGLIFNNIFSLIADENYLYAGTQYGGVWRRPLSEMTTSTESFTTNLPIGNRLDQNFPDPFNPTTTFSIGIHSKCFVTMKVFDLLGRQVATIINEYLSAGVHHRQWNATGNSSGIYFYRLQASSFIETKKLVILR